MTAVYPVRSLEMALLLREPAPRTPGKLPGGHLLEMRQFWLPAQGLGYQLLPGKPLVLWRTFPSGWGGYVVCSCAVPAPCAACPPPARRLLAACRLSTRAPRSCTHSCLHSRLRPRLLVRSTSPHARVAARHPPAKPFNHLPVHVDSPNDGQLSAV